MAKIIKGLFKILLAILIFLVVGGTIHFVVTKSYRDKMLETLEKHYQKGEITKEQYLQYKQKISTFKP